MLVLDFWVEIFAATINVEPNLSRKISRPRDLTHDKINNWGEPKTVKLLGTLTALQKKHKHKENITVIKHVGSQKEEYKHRGWNTSQRQYIHEPGLHVFQC